MMRYTTLLVLLVTLQLSFTESRRFGPRHKRQHSSNLYQPESFIIPGGEGSRNERWSDWGAPSNCSRPCGGGVAYQERECLDTDASGTPSCTGGTKKYFSCNTQDCPEREQDFRKQQCSEFNDVPFEGHRYQWVPYTRAPNPCELNCMPFGERFYYRHRSKVIDGTRCNDESFDVCVDGTCQPVGCDMMLGSQAKEDKCRVCRGDGSSCKTVSGVLDQTNLQVGYNDLLLVPTGATNVVINERAPSNNYLAIRNLTGFYHLNGNYRIDFPRTITFAGCDWHYERRPQGFAAPDRLTCLGPTTESVYLVLLAQDRNVGVQYEYSVSSASAPVDEPDSYSWMYTEFQPCTVSCGGGVQSRNVTCNSKSSLREVDEGLCNANEKPTTTQKCGQQACPPRWFEGPWSNCSKPCGTEGKQTREVYCERLSADGETTKIEDEVCLEHVGNKPATERECNQGTICPEWHIGKWSPCNKLCGDGERTRKVTCFRKENGRITVLDDGECITEKPIATEKCMLRPCEGVDYVTSSWSGCDECGATVETRTVHCASKSGTIYDMKFCEEREVPELRRECEMTPCDYQWFTSQWSKCSAVCGTGVQTRTVVCGVFDGQSLKRADDDYKCDATLKPEKERECNGPPECPGQWFAGPWTDCTKSCGGGLKSRKVICIANETVVPETNCNVDNIQLTTESCNANPCTEDDVIPVSVGTTLSIEDDYDEDELCEEDEEGSGDSDLIIGGEEPKSEKAVEETQEGVMMVTDDTSLAEGIEIGTSPSGTTESTLETDEVMLSDATGFETGATDADSATTDSAVEGSGGDDEESDDEKPPPYVIENTDEGSGGDSDDEDEPVSPVVTDKTEPTTGASVSDKDSTDASSGTEPSTTELESQSTTSEPSSSASSVDDSSETSVSASSVDFSSTDSTDVTTETTELYTSTTDNESTTEIDSSTVNDDLSTTEIASSSDIQSTTEDNIISSTSVSDSVSTTEVVEGSSTDVSSAENSTDTTILAGSDVTEQSSSESSATATTLAASSAISDSSSTEETVTEASSDGSTTVAGSSDSTDATESTEDFTGTTVTEDGLEETTYDIWSSSTSATDDGTEEPESSTPYTLSSVIAKEQKPRKCKPRPKVPKCAKSAYGCCPDGKTKATGPFSEGCSLPETCKETKYGCCPDGLSPATGPKDRGCPKSDCADTLFGCCPDKETPAEGNDHEGCPIETTTVAGCIISEFGCCDDGITEAKGPKSKGCPGVAEEEEPSATEKTTEPVPVPEGCASSEHGCCPDNTTEATGPNGEGCEPCSKEPYGCCPDGKTPAHGYNREGCCLQSPYGCCPDNVVPAQGPNQEGCECEYSPYGCCPDNKTSARGYGNAGCGCQYTEHGCCPDKETEAHGPNYEGCPCHAYQFGCCPDGATPAKGPHNQGCHCSHSEFKCCSDGQTAAKGPDGEGCTCAESKYGCCPDGSTEAQGTKFEGCTDVPESPQKACGLPKDKGTCSNYVVKHFFDVEYGGCGRFWYGGCDGNNNRFDSADDCKAVCETPTGKDVCHLPKITGPCTGHYNMWYYDAERNLCSQFTYGGCLGNANRFEKLEDCKALCSVDDSKPPCEQPLEHGPCNGTFERWYYDKETDVCQPFYYGGCKGNKNNYQSEASCNYHCKKPGVHKQKDTCFLPAETGECQNYTAHWYFDTKDNRCRQFYYGGCGGNGNNFVDEQSCINRCIDGGAKQEPAEPEAPERRPPVAETSPVDQFDRRYCQLPMDHGDRECKPYQGRFYFDSEKGVCTLFTYTGCGGNQNNFQTEAECEQACGREQNVCELPQERGDCESNEERWFYDRRAQRCLSFNYSGCGGNGNNFYRQDECERQCSGPTQVDLRGPTDPEPVQNASRCEQIPDFGNGEDDLILYYYDAERQTCALFRYSGSGGNTNRFASVEECDRVCGLYRGVDVCKDGKDAGPCGDAIPRFYYDSRTHACYSFNYSGCEGNGNRFASAEECEGTCVHRRTDETVDPADVLEICSLTVARGDRHCNGRNRKKGRKRWYYDVERETCFAFRYTGCGGNSNNFPSYNHCRTYCTIESNAVNPCERYEEECRLLQCQYGIAKSYDASNGCDRCQCNDPCDGQFCPPGTQCVVDVQSGRAVDASGSEFVGVCRATVKPGDCPPLANATQCTVDCSSDADCRGNNKCCDAGCARICIGPVDRPSGGVPAVPGVPGPTVLEEVPSEELDIKSEEGGVATLRCFATGYPPPSIRWRKGAIMLNTNQGRYVLTSTGDLQIVQLHRTDSGTYVCIADNGVGEPALREVQLTVNDPIPRDAYIAGNLNDSQVIQLGGPASLRCAAGGYPNPVVSWWRETFMMPLNMVNRDYSLNFASVRLQDLGPYVCQAYSGAGKGISRTVTLLAYGPVIPTSPVDEKYLKYVISSRPPISVPVVVRPPQVDTYPTRGRPPYVPPVVSRPPVPVTVAMHFPQGRNPVPNSNFTINCTVDGYPKPMVNWLKDGQIMVPTARIQITDDNLLIVNGAIPSDSGQYKCLARNEHSEAFQEQSLHVEGIYVPPECTDNVLLAKCDLIVAGHYCNHKYYAKFCCRSCTLAGQINIGNRRY
ncbi:papilin-like isoform X2 [Anopheles albimanus]|uniref:papilin-like isoform X2 n=1 Tax=Anopheles albimanus TaxID=7167 RepID=UPI00163EF10A|nr:papilin-like isoform X2 [Anopheles albimanus]